MVELFVGQYFILFEQAVGSGYETSDMFEDVERAWDWKAAWTNLARKGTNKTFTTGTSSLSE